MTLGIVMRASQRSTAKWIAIAVGSVAVIFLLVKLADYNRVRSEEREYKSLTLQYLNPGFSPAFCAYWQIDDLDEYKKALKQQFEIARFQAFEEAYGQDQEELLRFVRLRMINWLDRQFIYRAEWQLQFERRGERQEGPYSIDKDPLSEREFRKRVPF
jgi:hypothetical protein